MAEDFLGISAHVDIDEMVSGRIGVLFRLVYQHQKIGHFLWRFGGLCLILH